DAADHRVEVGRFEPEGQAVADWLARVSDRAVMVADLAAVQVHDERAPEQPPVQLQDEPAPDQQLLVLGAAMTTGGAQHPLVPAAGRGHVGDGDHWLGPGRRGCLVSHWTRLNAARTTGLQNRNTRTAAGRGKLNGPGTGWAGRVTAQIPRRGPARILGWGG